MSTIEALHIKGFQSHVDSQVRLCRGLNVITGPTDSGKTAIIRAVRWVAFNEPEGQAFVHEAVGEAEVVIQLENGVQVGKRRRKGKTAYYVTYPGQDPKVFEKSEVPEEVTKALGLNRQAFGDFEAALNFSFQLDAPFIISEPASAGAKVLGKLAGTEVVDLAIKAIAKDTHNYTAIRSQAKKDVAKFEGKVAEYADLDEQKAQLEACKYLMGLIETANDRRKKLIAFEDSYKCQASNIKVLAAELERLAILPEVEKTLQETEKALQYQATLQSFSDQLGHLERTLAGLVERVELFANLDDAAALLGALDGTYSRYATLVNLQSVYTTAAEEVKRVTAILNTTTQLAAAAESIAWLERAVGILSSLYTLRDNYTAVQAQIKRYSDLVEYLAPIDQAAVLFPTIDEQYARLQRLKELRAAYTLKGSTLTQAIGAANTAILAEERYRQELADIWASLEVCPLCEQPIAKGGCSH